MTSVVFIWLSGMETWLEEEVVGLLLLISRGSLENRYKACGSLISQVSSQAEKVKLQLCHFLACDYICFLFFFFFFCNLPTTDCLKQCAQFCVKLEGANTTVDHFLFPSPSQTLSVFKSLDVSLLPSIPSSLPTKHLLCLLGTNIIQWHLLKLIWMESCIKQITTFHPGMPQGLLRCAEMSAPALNSPRRLYFSSPFVCFPLFSVSCLLPIQYAYFISHKF